MKIQHNITNIVDADLGITIYRSVDAVEFFENVDAEKATTKIELRVHISQFTDVERTKPFSYEPKKIKILVIDNTTIVHKQTGDWIENNGVVYQENVAEEDKCTELEFYQNLLSQFVIAGLDRREDL